MHGEKADIAGSFVGEHRRVGVGPLNIWIWISGENFHSGKRGSAGGELAREGFLISRKYR